MQPPDNLSIARQSEHVPVVPLASGTTLDEVAHQIRLVVVVAAAGGHHLGLTGDCGSGMPAVARFLHSLLPEPDLRTAAQRSAALAGCAGLPAGVRVPWVAPHHTSSLPSLIGSGIVGRPGAVTFAHGGLLYLQDLPEFEGRFLHALVPALVIRQLTLARAGNVVTMPAGFQLVTSAHRCGCATAQRDCGCRESDRLRYRSRAVPVSRHLDIRADLGVALRAGADAGLAVDDGEGLPGKVMRVRGRAAARWGGSGVFANGQAGLTQLSVRAGGIAAKVRRVLDADRRYGLLSAAGYVAVSRIGWTLADLAGRDRPTVEDLLVARQLHGLPRR